MSLGVVVKGAEGIVLAADSRATIFREIEPAPGVPKVTYAASYDNATKMIRVPSQKHVAAVSFGLGALGTTEPRTPSSYMPEFDAELEGEARMSTKEFAERIGEFFCRQWKAANMPSTAPPNQVMYFYVAGYDDPTAPYGCVYELQVPSQPSPTEILPGVFGALWGGQRQVADRLGIGFDPALPQVIKEVTRSRKSADTLAREISARCALPIPWQFLPLQDCVDFAEFMVQATILMQTWMVDIRGVGGAIDIATLTRTVGFEEVRLKKVAAGTGFSRR